MMKRKEHEKLKLEAELLRLNALVRERREQLARIEECPNQACRCRAVWKEQVEKTLTGQMRKIRRQISAESAKTPKAKKTT